MKHLELCENCTKRIKTLINKAKHEFDAKPHNHPNGLIPNWDDQPIDIQLIFLSKIIK